MAEDINLSETLKIKTLKYFEERNIEIPIPVKNAIEDVFDENDFNHEYPDDDAVSLYSKNDIDEFEADTCVFTELEIQVGEGYSSGDVINKFTYYGELSTANAYTEYINLYNGEELVNEVKKIEKTSNNKLINPDDFCVIVLEEQIFRYGEFESIPRVFIYVPKEWSDE